MSTFDCGCRRDQGCTCPSPITTEETNRTPLPDFLINLEQRQTVEYFIQGQHPDGTWEQWSSTTTDPESAIERLAARRRMQPEFEYRIARRTTTVLVEAQQPEMEAADRA